MKLNEAKQLIKTDIERNLHPKNRFFIYCFRLGQWGYEHKESNIAAFIIQFVCRVLIKFTINKTNHYPMAMKLGGGVRIPHNIGIVISGKAVIGKNCTIFHQVTIGVDDMYGEAPIIGDNVFIGAGAKLIGGIIIGDNVKIGANAVVTKNVPDNSTVINNNQILRNDHIAINGILNS